MDSNVFSSKEISFKDGILNGRVIIAGPCTIESYDQLKQTAQSVKNSGADILRGGAFKPRTSPFSFQGLKDEGLEMLKSVRKEVGIKVVTELMDVRDIEKIYDSCDIIQIGSRNMQNFTLLKEVGKLDKPIVLKRGISATIKEWIGAAEYIAVEGNMEVIFCERGIRTFSDCTRNTLDISAVPIVKKLTGMPVIVDPSHAAGRRDLIEPLSLAGLACGADGIMVEVHPQPDMALCDGDQSIDFNGFDELMKKIRRMGL
ncbi:3-deoxy-D-arabinoheptulosonate-7-phosphate synthase [Peptoclostridium litorale DSM 5388]|uniref:Phospho-2-dehydro-3-deoxyheptonate aldolase AroF n=1 Tax=Peptoclostridium litorale DSM 5388 TaxID=1121324 RepID=A0A069REG3_PEPLI|nr:3-deoxy-7-phosphoheptulonate synthase [Peptoclostridium litorale]KDR95143.1 phospho-2-dehydro-3-deoxyheptonate aldolase AroF [Peptoclostridium litorale DSM 5388]SIN74311.1 3-deoxy-D-arabinoheptulosonate-7-phosphate synthase [Peptoclostridium litorale DSM 5388]